MATPLNNISTLPIYSSTDDRQASKWWVYGQVYPLFWPYKHLPQWQVRVPKLNASIAVQCAVYSEDGTLVLPGNTLEVVDNIEIISGGDDYDYIVYTDTVPLDDEDAFIGRYYLKITATLSGTGAGTITLYSDIFTLVDDISPYLMIEWWDTADFSMDNGESIIWKYPGAGETTVQLKRRLYLASDLAKPDYIFTEEGQERDGYFYPTKQLSEKRYRFGFMAPEYLLDVMRFIRMADYVKVTYRGVEYNCDTFLITPEWENNGDLASVSAEFDTDTVAKKLGGGYYK